MMLNGWKEIARYLGRGVRTVQRWEDFGLPIRRPAGHIRSAVIAIPEEVDRWVRQSASAVPDPDHNWGQYGVALFLRARQTRSEARELRAELLRRRTRQRHLITLMVEKKHRAAEFLIARTQVRPPAVSRN